LVLLAEKRGVGAGEKGRGSGPRGRSLNKGVEIKGLGGLGGRKTKMSESKKKKRGSTTGREVPVFERDCRRDRGQEEKEKRR